MAEICNVYDYIREQCENRPENIQYHRRVDGFEVTVMDKIPHTITMSGSRVQEMLNGGLCSSQILEYILHRLSIL